MIEMTSGRLCILDSESTGFEWKEGHRLLEIGIVEYFNRKPTGKIYHRYFDPQRDVPEEAYAVHGISRDDAIRLGGGKTFQDILPSLRSFLKGDGSLPGPTTVVAHNASFDIGFLNWEMNTFGASSIEQMGIGVIDSLSLARAKHPGKRNNLDALVSRYLPNCDIDRELHGALKDAMLLSMVFMEMTVQQNTLQVEESYAAIGPILTPERVSLQRGALRVASVSKADRERHEASCARIAKKAGNEAVALTLEF
ncbi:DNA polymerase-3 subunit epsilon [Pseudomonas nitritireducens]|uniref:DNA-directed DNA polymerase n=1 Tax=Pseudomonas nitroreducens TaxID=46680 RepID=A0A7W7KFJ5_PSENT|nr:exonuclease domain-containing protein [Pseudomonas nitritireducens]MBB4861358.1 DNA polymerase-3 subunit epsilon [Pseudomonas nitritireducens]